MIGLSSGVHHVVPEMKYKNKHNKGNRTKSTQNKSIHPDKVGELQPQEGGKAISREKCKRRSKMNITKHNSSLGNIVPADPNL